jgi:polyisoprenoid-binding protein YceI
MRHTLLALIAAYVTVTGFAPPQRAGVRTFDVDPANSTATIEVGKSGPLSFVAGHSHKVDAPGLHGIVRLAAENSGVDLTVPVGSMSVSSEHESAGDRPKIQQTMMSAEVLDAQNHPTMTFRSTSVVIRSQTAASLDALVEGRLTIRGETRTVSVPVHADLSGQTLTAAAHFTVRQSDYGIKPVSVGGVVAVKDELAITLHIVGRERE